MKKDKVKKISLIAFIVFLSGMLFLTYFSGTIDAMLLPNVKTTEVIRVESNEEGNYYNQGNSFLVPVKAVSDFGGNATVYVVNWLDGNYYANAVNVTVLDTDGMYYEVDSSALNGGIRVVYNTSKPLTSGDRVYVVEE